MTKDVQTESTRHAYNTRRQRLTPAEYERRKKEGTLRQGDH